MIPYEKNILFDFGYFNHVFCGFGAVSYECK